MSKKIQSTNDIVYQAFDDFAAAFVFEEDVYFDFINKLVKQLRNQCKNFAFDVADNFLTGKRILFDFGIFHGELGPMVFAKKRTETFPPKSEGIGFDIEIEVSEVDKSKLDQKEKSDIDIIEKTSEGMYELITRDYADKNNKKSVWWYAYPDKNDPYTKDSLELSSRGLIRVYKGGGRSICFQYNKELETIELKPLNSLGAPLYIIRKNSVKLNTGYSLNQLRKSLYAPPHFAVGIDKKEDLLSDKFIEDVVSKFKAAVDHFFDANKKYIDNLHKEHSKNISTIKDYLLTALDILDQNA